MRQPDPTGQVLRKRHRAGWSEAQLGTGGHGGRSRSPGRQRDKGGGAVGMGTLPLTDGGEGVAARLPARGWVGGARVPAPAGRAGSRVGAAGADWLPGARAGRAAARGGPVTPQPGLGLAAHRRAPPRPRARRRTSPTGGHHEHRPAVQEQAGDSR